MAYLEKGSARPGAASMIGALAINGAMIAAIIYSVPDILPQPAWKSRKPCWNSWRPEGVWLRQWGLKCNTYNSLPGWGKWNGPARPWKTAISYLCARAPYDPRIS